ncbi:MAG: hypothetical protein LW635_00990, partial [Microcystis sp. 53598_E5]|nr:hypothetical protein [Microcystis sp. 53598_E5]
MLYDLLLTKHTLILVFPEHTFSFTGFGWDDNLLMGLRQKTNREKPQLQSPLGIYFEKPKIAET